MGGAGLGPERPQIRAEVELSADNPHDKKRTQTVRD